MSQKEVLRILKDLGGRATSSEIRQQAKRDFPDRKLYNYVSMRLESLQNRDLVLKEETDNGICWAVSKEGNRKQLKKHTIDDSCDEMHKVMLEKEGVTIVNIVSTIYTEKGTNFDLYELYENIPNSEYNPEDDGYLTFYPPECENATVRIPSTGVLNITGAKSKEEVFSGLSCFNDKICGLGYNIDFCPEDIEVQNIVGTSSIQKEIDLTKLATDMPNNVEYDVNKNAALIFRPVTQGTVMMYRTGKVIATGVKTYEQMVSLYEQLNKETPPIENANISFS